MNTWTVFYAGLVHSDYGPGNLPRATALPDGCLVYCTKPSGSKWLELRSMKFDRLEAEDVPPHYQALVLIMS